MEHVKNETTFYVPNVKAVVKCPQLKIEALYMEAGTHSFINVWLNNVVISEEETFAHNPDMLDEYNLKIRALALICDYFEMAAEEIAQEKDDEDSCILL